MFASRQRSKNDFCLGRESCLLKERGWGGCWVSKCFTTESTPGLYQATKALWFWFMKDCGVRSGAFQTVKEGRWVNGILEWEMDLQCEICLCMTKHKHCIHDKLLTFKEVLCLMLITGFICFENYLQDKYCQRSFSPGGDTRGGTGEKRLWGQRWGARQRTREEVTVVYILKAEGKLLNYRWERLILEGERRRGGEKRREEVEGGTEEREGRQGGESEWRVSS